METINSHVSAWVRVCGQRILTQTSKRVQVLEHFGCQCCGSGVSDLYCLSASDFRIQILSLDLSPALGCLRGVSNRTCPNPALGAPLLPCPPPSPLLLSQGQLHVLLRLQISTLASSPLIILYTASNPPAILLAPPSKYIPKLTTSHHLHYPIPS